MKTFVATLVALLTLVPAASAQEPGLSLIPPVDGAISVRFEAPVRKWGSGHRGIDYAVPAGTAVRAAAAGHVTFAGSVAGTLAVTIDHGPLQTTYSSLSSIDVSEGAFVDTGTWIGTAGESHPGEGAGLHLGVKDGDVYLDPALFLGPADASAAIHLVPVVDTGIEDVPRRLHPFALSAGDHREECAERAADEPAESAPNDNVVVAINGLGSHSTGPADTDLYAHAVDLLDYPEERAYLFSYDGIGGPRLHDPYEATSTFGDLAGAAEKLRTMLRAVARRHPGADVDLVAHSQGGLIARLYLQRLATSWSAGLPRVEHLVTLATPHTGAPIADLSERMRTTTVGAPVTNVLSHLARATQLFPDPNAVAVAQLSPSSDLSGLLAQEDVAFGTRVLSLAVPDDLAVPAHRARLEHEQNLTLPPAGGFAHSRIVESERAAAVAHDFLRDAAPTCEGGWHTWGPRVGRVLELAEDALW